VRRGEERDAEVPAGESVVRMRVVNGPFGAGRRAEGRALGPGEPGGPGEGSSSAEALATGASGPGGSPRAAAMLYPGGAGRRPAPGGAGLSGLARRGEGGRLLIACAPRPVFLQRSGALLPVRPSVLCPPELKAVWSSVKNNPRL